MSDDLREQVARAIFNSLVDGHAGWDQCPDSHEDYLLAADAALAEIGAVRVRELEWEVKSERTQWASVRHVADRYIIEDRLHGPHYDLWVGFNATSAQRFDTIEAAKAAAQADYEARILAAIEPAPSVREAARVLLNDRWRGYENKDAREAMWNHIHDVHGRHMLPMSAYSGVLIAALRAIAEGKDDE